MKLAYNILFCSIFIMFRWSRSKWFFVYRKLWKFSFFYILWNCRSSKCLNYICIKCALKITTTLAGTPRCPTCHWGMNRAAQAFQKELSLWAAPYGLLPLLYIKRSSWVWKCWITIFYTWNYCYTAHELELNANFTQTIEVGRDSSTLLFSFHTYTTYRPWWEGFH